MVDAYGRWMPESNYDLYPKEKWCDFDYVADLIIKWEYKIKTNLENLVKMIILHYDCEIEESDGYYCCPRKPGNYMINIDDVAEFLRDNGISEFDYYA